jgi:hypothetical protein
VAQGTFQSHSSLTWKKAICPYCLSFSFRSIIYRNNASNVNLCMFAHVLQNGFFVGWVCAWDGEDSIIFFLLLLSF